MLEVGKRYREIRWPASQWLKLEFIAKDVLIFDNSRGSYVHAITPEDDWQEQVIRAEKPSERIKEIQGENPAYSKLEAIIQLLDEAFEKAKIQVKGE